MTTERWRRVEALFAEALEVEGEERRSFLEERCGDDEELRAEVQRLLSADGKAGGFIEDAVLAGAASVANSASSQRVGQQVGSYKLVESLGRGGMSSVYRAVRTDDQFSNVVAIKLVRRGMGTEDILRRLRSERQILASLNHPNIAKLYDGGTTDDGMPYFVMEYIDGSPIDDYCDAHRLDIGQRLALFRQVCSAVHYAHRSLVVHRDLKPSNVLVTRDGTPKLLDFGIAKLLNPARFGEAWESTALYQRLMTPGYASPEQIRGGAITTASDVYSLGVLLFELLTGRRPYDVERTASLQELEKVICDDPPTRPSTACLLTPEAVGDESSMRLSDRRGEKPETLARRLRGDLDNILLMALRKEPERRYGSVEQLSEDLQRFMAGHPVIARRDTLGYRAGKFVQRHRLGVAAVAGGVVLALVFATAMWRQTTRTAWERDRAETLSTMLVNMFQKAGESKGARLTAEELLDHGAIQALQEGGEQPETQAMLLDALGGLYRDLGLFHDAAEMYQRAADLHAQERGPGDPLTVSTRYEQAKVVARGGDFLRAEGMFREVLERRLALYGDHHAEVAAPLNSLALSLHEQGRYAEALPLYRRAIDMDRALLGDEHPHTLLVLANYGLLLHDKADYADAERQLRATLESQRRLDGPESEDYAESLDLLGQALHAQGRFREAEQTLRHSLKIRLALFGDRHPFVARTLNHLGDLLREDGRLEEAGEHIQEALDQREGFLEIEHSEVAESLLSLGELQMARGEMEAARESLSRAVEIYSQSLSPQHPMTGRALAGQGRLAAAQGDCQLAVSQLSPALAQLPSGDYRAPAAARALGECLSAQGRRQEAQQWLEASREGFQRRFGAEHPGVMETESLLAGL